MSRTLNRLTIALAACASLAACKDKPAPAAPVIRPVRTITVAAASTASARTFSRVMQSSAESRLSFKVAGTIRTLKVKVGQRVKAGQLIGELDDKDFKLQVQQAQASYAQA